MSEGNIYITADHFTGNVSIGDNVHQTLNSNIPHKKVSEEQLLQNNLLLARLDRTEHFNKFDEGYKTYQNEITDYYQKPLIFILHGEESAQLDLITWRIHHYDVRRVVDGKKLKDFCDIPKDIEIKYYPLLLNGFDSKKLTEALSNAVCLNASESIDNITKQLARENIPIIIELNVCTEHLDGIREKQSALLKFITYWVNLEKIEQTKPLFIVLTFKYQTSFIPKSANKAIRNVLNQVKDKNFNNVIVLPEFGKLKRLEVTGWLKNYFSLCKEHQPSNDVDKLFQSSKLLTMKQATKKLERLLNEYCL